MLRSSLLSAVAAIVVTSLVLPGRAEAAPGTPDSLYVVGNSLTHDANGAGAGVAGLVSLQGDATPTFGRHIRSASGLSVITGQPGSISITSPAPFGTYETALSGFAWDALTLQPYNETVLSAAEAIESIVGVARSGPTSLGATDVLIYTGWPAADGYVGGQANFDATGSFAQKWNRGYDGTPATTGTRDYFDQLFAELASRPSLDDVGFRLIPAGDVLAEVDRRARDGLIPGLSSAADLYRDRDHMTGPGQYLAGVTTLATLTGESPVGLGVPVGAYGNVIRQEDELRLALQQAAWDVVRQDQLAAIPEPATAGVALLGAGVLALRRRAARVS